MEGIKVRLIGWTRNEIVGIDALGSGAEAHGELLSSDVGSDPLFQLGSFGFRYLCLFEGPLLPASADDFGDRREGMWIGNTVELH